MSTFHQRMNELTAEEQHEWIESMKNSHNRIVRWSVFSKDELSVIIGALQAKLVEYQDGSTGRRLWAEIQLGNLMKNEGEL